MSKARITVRSRLISLTQRSTDFLFARRSRPLVYAVAITLLSAANASAFLTNTVEKVADLSFFVDADGGGHGGYAPLDRITQVGTNLWFTTSKGGYLDLGTISRFDLTSHQVIQQASLDNNTGSKPESPLTFIGTKAYFTTVSAGVSNKGTIAQFDADTGTVTPLFAFPNNGLPTGATPRAGVTLIGNDLWTLTQSGGISNRGAILKFNLTTQTATPVASLDGPVLGGQAFDGLTQAGDAYYYVTFSGGNTFKSTNYPTSVLPDGTPITLTNVLSLGAGVLGRITFDNAGAPQVATAVNLPGGFEQFPAVAPVLVGTNSLYFTSTGPNSLPGAILRYDLDSGYFTNLFSFPTNPISALQYGTRPGYSGLTEWQGELYFISRNGGAFGTAPNSGGGIVGKFNIASNTVIKLADLGNPVGAADLGSPSGFFGAGAVVFETNRFYVYYPLTAGGANGVGSIIRVALPPLPIQASLTATNNGANFVLSWSGGYPPFDVLSTSDLTTASEDWPVVVTNINSPDNTTNWSVVLPALPGSTFYRVRGQAQ